MKLYTSSLAFARLHPLWLVASLILNASALRFVLKHV